MSIRIIKEAEIALTQGEYERFQREWERHCLYHCDPPTFEDFVRRERERGKPSYHYSDPEQQSEQGNASK